MNCALLAKMDQVFSLKNKTLKTILEKWQKILEKSGNFVSTEKWEPWCHLNFFQSIQQQDKEKKFLHAIHVLSRNCINNCLQIMLILLWKVHLAFVCLFIN